ncbi:MAG TPA: GDSL-type esterase/lipase family protein [Solirubrobacteraceae bacterium]|jgi:lysophospholipase L1-like esterase|nr:GDSL-type esterase/lipase family protein [Solirubrobacteraceae bacterium]
MPPTQPEHPDDNLMERFDRAGTRRFRARDAVAAVAIIAAILVLSSGTSIRKAGEQMNPGIGRDAVLGVGRPAGWIADHLPVRSAAHNLTAWLSPDPNLSGLGGFNQSVAIGASAGIPPVTPDAFDPTQIGAPPPPRRPLRSLLVTGDSMSQPLDQYVAQALAPSRARVFQDPHFGTGISSTVLVDWAKLSSFQVIHDHPDAVVVFLGANDGYSMPGPDGRLVSCCSPEWAAIYAGRVRRVMNTFRQAGTARVYWLTLPAQRDPARDKIALVVNAAIEVAAEPWRDQVRIIDTVPVFTPGDRYRDSMPINGTPTIVRESDGIHLNGAGSALASKLVLAAVDKDFTR